MDAPSVQYVTTSDGLNIAFSVAGSGTPFVLLPAAINHLDLRWRQDKLIQPLAARFMLVQYDGRGQGLSTRDLGSDHTAERYLLDLEAVIDHLDLQKVVLLGAALFADIAVRYAVKYPRRVTALLLYNARLDVNHHFSTYLESIATTDWNLLRQVVARTATFGIEPPELATEYIDRSVTQADWLARVRAFKESNLVEMLSALRCPTLVMAPADGALLGEEDGRLIAARVPGARLVLTYEEDYGERFATQAEDFLRQVVLDEQTTTSGHPESNLSNRELEVLRLIAAGRSNAQIAGELVISPSTVLHHVTNILTKTGSANRTEAAMYAARNGLA